MRVCLESHIVNGGSGLTRRAGRARAVADRHGDLTRLGLGHGLEPGSGPGRRPAAAGAKLRGRLAAALKTAPGRRTRAIWNLALYDIMIIYDIRR